MSKFAKLFDVADTQVLFVIDEDDMGYPAVIVTMKVHGLTLTHTIAFRGMAENAAWDKAEKVFDLMNQGSADRHHAKTLIDMADMAAGEFQ